MVIFGAAEGIRTPNLLIRSQMRYPITPQLQMYTTHYKPKWSNCQTKNIILKLIKISIIDIVK